MQRYGKAKEKDLTDLRDLSNLYISMGQSMFHPKLIYQKKVVK